MAERVQELPRLDGQASEVAPPLGGYALLISTFLGLVGGFVAWFRRSGRELPARVDARDLALLTVATHKSSRVIAKARVTSAARAPFTRFQGSDGPSEVREAPRGTGLRRVVGELIICPYCLSMWIGAAFLAGLLVAPRTTRWVASMLGVVFGSDVLQIAYRKAEETLER